jgi:hypothetical protein
MIARMLTLRRNVNSDVRVEFEQSVPNENQPLARYRSDTFYGSPLCRYQFCLLSVVGKSSIWSVSLDQRAAHDLRTMRPLYFWFEMATNLLCWQRSSIFSSCICRPIRKSRDAFSWNVVFHVRMMQRELRKVRQYNGGYFRLGSSNGNLRWVCAECSFASTHILWRMASIFCNSW